MTLSTEYSDHLENRMDNYDLKDLSECFGLPLDRLRYVFNQKLVPQRDWFIAEDEVGRPRQFDFVDAVFIGCAVYLLEAGVKRDAVRAYMQVVGRMYAKKH